MTPDFDAPPERRGTGSSKWSRYPPDVLPLWVADMDFAVAPCITAALRARVDHDVFGYGIARPELREAIVARLKRLYEWTVAPDAIVILPGVEPGFNMALKAFLRPGDGVLVQTPIYRPILNAPGFWELRRIDVELQQNGSRYATAPDILADGLAQARAFLLCNPHNPTGKVYDRDELTAIAQLCERHDTLIISDEIHGDLVFAPHRHIPIATLDRSVEARTITLMSASKTFNIAGLKTAFAVIPNEALRRPFEASRVGMVDSVNVLGLEATLAAFQKGEPWRRELLATLEANRDWLMAVLRTRLPAVRTLAPEGTFLAWLDCSALNLPGDPQSFFLDRARVAMSAGSEFGEPFGSFVRLNFGCARSTLAAALDRMVAAVAAAR